MAATPYPGYPTMRTRSPAAQREPGKPSRMAATPYPGYPTMRTRSPAERCACLGNALAWETLPDGGYALSGLPNDAYP
ncbi:hypothetical protein [Klebsiella pneumoniae]|uniref:hypothetical protein n=1 Tax=Klebsiella pneumoniae TaxID=573 RepID=UPI00122C9802|nr:hypothetical protein [Klebsiella pneumoniae]KAA1619424.1 hypothetical protein F1D34_14030 [Klebsiella pneumoniae]